MDSSPSFVLGSKVWSLNQLIFGSGNPDALQNNATLPPSFSMISSCEDDKISGWTDNKSVKTIRKENAESAFEDWEASKTTKVSLRGIGLTCWN